MNTRCIVNAALAEFGTILLDGAWDTEADPLPEVVALAYVMPNDPAWPALDKMRLEWVQQRRAPGSISRWQYQFRTDDDLAAMKVARVVYDGFADDLLVFQHDDRPDDATMSRVFLAFDLGRAARSTSLQAIALDAMITLLHFDADVVMDYALPRCDEDGHETVYDLERIETLVHMSRAVKNIDVARDLLDIAEAALAYPAKRRQLKRQSQVAALMRGAVPEAK